MSTLIDSVAAVRAKKAMRLVKLDIERAGEALRSGANSQEAIEQARWLVDTLAYQVDGMRRGWQLDGRNQTAVELSLRSLECDLAVAATDPALTDEVGRLLARLNAGDMQLMAMVNETMSRVQWIAPRGVGG